MENHPPPAERFKKVLLSLSELMRKELNKARKKGINVINENIIDFGIALINEADDDKLIRGFIKRSFPLVDAEDESKKRVCCWDSVLQKDKKFFFSNSSFIFGELSSGIVDGIFVIIKDKEDDDDGNKYLIEGIWKHLFSMIKICINFIYLRRQPKVECLAEGGYNIKYSNNKYDYIHLEELALKWSVNLLNAR
jgi:hypothetical protein